jgi:predicted lipoprotein with Yx(FWY)xxD motif
VRSWFVTKVLGVDHRAGLPAGRAAERPGGALERPGSRSGRERLGVLRRPLMALVALTAVGALAAGCGSSGSGSGSSGASTPMSGGVATVSATSSTLGMILVDGSGRTLYLFEKDRPDQSACSGACAVAWPVDQSSGSPKAGSDVKASLLGTIKRSDGTTQVTYNRHPLYYFSDDSGAGQQNGQGVDAFGAVWFAVAPAGDAVRGGATATTAAGSGYGGYGG